MPKPRKQTTAATVIVASLAKKAKKGGGDRYDSDDGAFTPYVPQSVSRPNGGEPVKTMKFTIEPA